MSDAQLEQLMASSGIEAAGDVMRAMNLAFNLTDVTSHSGGGESPDSAEDAGRAFVELLRKNFRVESRCLYERLRFLDESMNDNMPRHHFEALVQDAYYPHLGEHICQPLRNFLTVV